MRVPDIVGLGYVFYPVMLMMFAFAGRGCADRRGVGMASDLARCVCDPLWCPLRYCVQVGAS
jgi:hypothetical protein